MLELIAKLKENFNKNNSQNKKLKYLTPRLGAVEINSIKNSNVGEVNPVKDNLQITNQYQTNIFNAKRT